MIKKLIKIFFKYTNLFYNRVSSFLYGDKKNVAPKETKW